MAAGVGWVITQQDMVFIIAERLGWGHSKTGPLIDEAIAAGAVTQDTDHRLRVINEVLDRAGCPKRPA